MILVGNMFKWTNYKKLYLIMKDEVEEKIKREYKRLFLTIDNFKIVMELNGLDYNSLVVYLDGYLNLPIDKYRYYISQSLYKCLKSPENKFKTKYISDSTMLSTSGWTKIQIVLAPKIKYTKKIKNKEAKAIQRTYIPFFELFIKELKNYEKIFNQE